MKNLLGLSLISITLSQVAAGDQGGLMGELFVWDLTAKKGGPVGGKFYPLYGVAFAPDGKSVAVAGINPPLTVIDLAKGERVRVLRPHRGGADQVCFLPRTKRLLSVSLDGPVSIWDLGNGKVVHQWQIKTTGKMTCALDGSLIAVVESGPEGQRADTVRVLETSTGKTLAELPTKQRIASLAVSADRKLLAAGCGPYGEPVIVWDLEKREEKARPAGGTSRVAFSPVGHLLVMADFKTQKVRFWDAQTDKQWLGPQKFVNLDSLAFSPDGKTLAVGGIRSYREEGGGVPEVSLWNVASGERVALFTGHKARNIGCLAFSPDGKKLASVSWDKQQPKGK